MEPIIFQIIDWEQYNETQIDNNFESTDEQESEDELEKELFGLSNNDSNKIDKYKIRLYGRMQDGKSILVNVNNYTPFFYIKVHKDWTETKIRTLINSIKTKISSPKAIKGFKSFDILMKKDLYGFTGYQDYKFVRLIFHNMYSYKKFENWISRNKITNSMLSKYPIKLPLYESNIEPFIRCMHIRKLSACGWVKITKYEKYDLGSFGSNYSSNYSYCDTSIQTDWTNLDSYDSNSIQKFIIASWDIECMSLSGDFPQAIHPEDRENFDIMIANLIKKLKNNDNKYKYMAENKIKHEILTNPELFSEYRNFEFKHSGDPLIQIGTVFSYYGESEPYAKSIISLGGCDKVKGLEDVEIQSLKTESQVLLSWTKLIQKMDPDVITGWNINGFDFQYIYDRAIKLKCLGKFSELSRLKNEKSEFVEKELSSSALGDNLLKFFSMSGRIVIDMMKERQREAKLDSYKLDFVASTYIKEKVIMCEIMDEVKKSIIYTSSVYGIKSDDYINIAWDDGLNENKHDSKLKIIELEKVEQDEIANLVTKVETYPKYSDYVFKKPKSLYKLVLDGTIPDEIFEIEEGNEPMWKNIIFKTNINGQKTKSKLYFQIDGYTNYNSNTNENEDIVETNSNSNLINSNSNLSWIDIKYNESIIPIRGNKIFWAHAKDDISPKDLFRLYKGSDADRGIIAKYCVMDCVLVTKLMEKLKVLNNNIGMANVCGVPLNYIFMRGQGVKIFSLVSKKCRELGFLIPKKTPADNKKNKGKEPEPFDPEHPHKNYKKKIEDSDDEKDEEKVGYEGATVFEPVKGIHYEPIPVLDYASLYPSSMIYMNISHECYVNNPAYDNMVGYEYKEAIYKNSDGTTTTCKFAKKKDGTKGVLCQILEELLKKRKETKKLMGAAEAEGNYFLSSIYDGLQLAYKITANSLYGQVGAPTSPIYMKELAASTTATGRIMLKFAKVFIEDIFGELINDAILDKDTYYKKMTELFEGIYLPLRNYIDPDGDNISKVYVKTPERKFIEPKENRQVMIDYIDYFYTRTNELLNSNYKVKPRVIYGDSVTPDTPILLLNRFGNVEIRKIEEIGKIWTNYSQFKSGVPGLEDKQQDDIIDYKVWTDKGWANIKRVIKHKTNKKIYEVMTLQGYVKVTEDHSLLDFEGNQIKPTDCELGTKLLHNREFEGFKKIYGEEPNEFINNYTNENDYYPSSQGTINFIFSNNEFCEAMKIYYACRALGYYVNINVIKSDNNESMTMIEISSSKVRPKNYDDYDKIIKINDLGYIDDYVYDLETDVGHFHAGVGSLIVKNTDSVFFTPKIHHIKTKQIMTNKACLRVSIELGILAGEVIGKILPEPEDLEYEKTFWPFIILTKKRYVGNLYETNFESFKQKSMGIVLKRRDNAKIVKIGVGGIVDYILNGKFGDVDITNRNKGAINYTRTLLKRILQGYYPIDKFVITKTLRARYKGTKKTDDENGEVGQKGSWYWEDVNCPLAHVTLCQRMAERNPGNKPESNDRIPYVYIIPNGKVKLQGDRIEDPNYVLEQKIELDYLFYITNQIMKPAIQFLEHIATNPEKIFNNYINKEINRRKKTNPVDDYITEYNLEENISDELKTKEKNNYDSNNNKCKNLNKTKKTKTFEKNLNDKSINSEDKLIYKIKTDIKQSLTINI